MEGGLGMGRRILLCSDCSFGPFIPSNWYIPSNCLCVAFEWQGKCPNVNRSFVVAEEKCSWLQPPVPVSNFSSNQASSIA